MRLRLAILVALSTLLVVAGCGKNEGSLTGPHEVICDSANVKYSTCVQPIFKSYCYRCHSDSASQNGSIAFDIENFQSLKTYLKIYYRNDSIYGSKFYHVISQTAGVVYMPPTGKLPESDLAIVKKWLDAFAPDN